MTHVSELVTMTRTTLALGCSVLFAGCASASSSVPETARVTTSDTGSEVTQDLAGLEEPDDLAGLEEPDDLAGLEEAAAAGAAEARREDELARREARARAEAERVAWLIWAAETFVNGTPEEHVVELLITLGRQDLVVDARRHPHESMIRAVEDAQATAGAQHAPLARCLSAHAEAVAQLIGVGESLPPHDDERAFYELAERRLMERGVPRDEIPDQLFAEAIRMEDEEQERLISIESVLGNPIAGRRDEVTAWLRANRHAALADHLEVVSELCRAAL